MQVTHIFIARHGETEYNRTNRIQGRGINEPLNDTGRSQAQAIGEMLGAKSIQYVFSSSLKRSMETAQIIADRLMLEIESYQELDEMNFGIIEGQPIEDIGHHLEELHKNWKSGNTTFALDEGESPEQVLQRVLWRMDLLLKEHRGRTMLFVLHGRLIRILLSHWLGYGLREMHRVKHQNGALYHMRLQGKEIQPVFLNEISHLQAYSTFQNNQ